MKSPCPRHPTDPSRLRARCRPAGVRPATASDSPSGSISLIPKRSAGAASAKTALCADKPDLSTTPGRMAFAEKMMETRLASLKTIQPKLQAFYDSLDAKQKKAFDTGGRVGGMFDWWGKQ
ncbi:MAG TPA: Spy/CpxP family protein refolding chaperone [Roseiarcus sp.]|nr:Spy/CpxP family protein refolding chaperone [Roseiarcus sp.]